MFSIQACRTSDVKGYTEKNGLADDSVGPFFEIKNSGTEVPEFGSG